MGYTIDALREDLGFGRIVMDLAAAGLDRPGVCETLRRIRVEHDLLFRRDPNVARSKSLQAIAA